MKKPLITVCITLPASLMLFSSIAAFNSSAVQPVWRNRVFQADGVPLPPPPTKPNTVLTADGVPLPPPPTKPNTVLIADGVPLPPPPTKPNTVLIADGVPLPPPPTKPNGNNAIQVSDLALLS